ncbi:tyrosine-type recombinase/integrase [Agromyces aerolatus]|uniref:tyrosine-type recombinase/integrase n=1 Tax=Agromyces sp. LY-1074 TaxID=3074080 RepID=UPI00285587C4|nr:MULTISPECIES: tyrosine-type recombinase/integrase [unclassified Agromyces]MDR5699860.1 tyrosine-type recombinase/integrase [Agromyces sp. LY-1074]MDR5706328.1 tyrosine-type recombinase/integrase [Agromyces sp. LY-1358]
MGHDWAATLAAFAADERAAGRAVSTVTKQAGRVARLADALGCDPLTARAGAVVAYVEQLDAGRSSSTAKAERLAVRAFYRWAVDTGRRATDPLSGYRYSARPELAPAWAHALDAFATDEAARGIETATLAQRRKYLRAFAAMVEVGPWEVAHSDAAGYLDGLDVAASTRAAHRTALRAFYRWAASTGRVFADPMDYSRSGPRAAPVPDAWVAPLRERTSYLRSGGRAETSIATYLDVLRHLSRQTHHGPFELTTDDLAAWMGNKRWGRETRRRNRQTLKTFYRWAVDTGRTSANPVDVLPRVKAAQPSARPAELDEYREALSRAGDLETLALRLAAELGMRRGEVARTHTRDVQGERGARVLVVRGKGAKVRRIPLPDGLAAQITRRPAGYVFPGNDQGHWSPRWLGRRVGQLLPAGVNMHQLRHSFATRAYAIDRDLLGVQQLLGHASPATTRGYVQLQPAQLRRLVEGVAQ